MSGRTAFAAGALVAILAAAAAGQQNPPAQTTFRATTDLVTVDVAVRVNGAPVAGLTAADFVLLDNGVAQKIESVSMAAVPVEVTVLVDNNEDVADDLAGMHEQVRRIAALLRPSDRLRLTTASSSVVDVVPATAAAGIELPAQLTPAGLSSAYDGLIAALLRRIEPNRPHLVFALTNGIDALSSVDTAAVLDVARRSQATLCVVQVDVALAAGEGAPLVYTSGRERVDSHRCSASGLCSPTRRFWIPFEQREFGMLREIAESTGGALYLPGVFTDRSASAIFRKVFDDYRRSYLLRYVPQGVAREGWHELSVSIPSHPGYTVHARRGYAVDPPASPPPERPVTSPVPDDVDSLAAAYDDHPIQVADRFRQLPNLSGLIERMQDGSTPWPANPRRESAFVIELAHAALHSSRAADRNAGRGLLTAHHRLVRHPLGPDPFERFWLWAALAILQGVRDPGPARAFADRALARFPDEPRFLLARAFLADQRRVTGALPPAHVKEVLALYDAALRHAEARDEARIRQAWLLHRAERHEEALALLDAAAQPADATLQYFRHFHRGQILEALARPDAAIDAYRAALALGPHAQSPRVRLMALLLKQGDRPAAEMLAAEVETAPADAWDPAWTYWIGDYRSYGEIVRRLREQTR